MTRLWMVLMVSGCWRHDDPPVHVPEPPSVTVLPVCPHTVSTEWTSHLWAHELFPGCPPAPFETVGVTCTAAGCPTPCRARTSLEGNPTTETRYMYSDGHFVEADGVSVIGASYNDGTPWSSREHCDYVGARVASCKVDRGDIEIMRDANGRVTEIHSLDNGTDYDVVPTYAGNGEITAVRFTGGYRTSTLLRDAAHRLIGENEVWLPGSGTARESSTIPYTYEYDQRGRWVHASMGDTSYSYNATTDALVKIVAYSNLGETTTTIDYDAQHRPRRIVDTTVNHGRSSVRAVDYDYECH